MSFMKNKIIILLLILIFSIGALLRLYHLGSTPPSLNWDEVSLGYNAWSILTTGRDEYGEFLPVILRSYDDYKPALYSYFLIPFIALIGISDIVVRLPSALFGSFGIVLVYFLVKEIFIEKSIEFSNKKIDTRFLGLAAAFLFAISPWDIQFSRIAFESQIGTILNLLSLLFFLKGIRKGLFFPLSFLFASLSIHMYQSEKVFVPLMLIFISLLNVKKIWVSQKYYYLIGVIIAFVVALPLLLNILTNEDVLLRAKGVSVFSNQTALLSRSSQKLIADKDAGYIPGLIMDNRRVEFIRQVGAGYLSHFDLNWLFISGDIGRHHAPSMGLLYLWELPMLFVGIYVLAFLKVKKEIKILLIGYLLLVPIPASITSGVPHAVRTMNFLGILEIVMALGLLQIVIWSFAKRSILKMVLFGVLGLFALLNFSYFLNQYFVQQNYYNSVDWLYGYRQAVDFIQPIHKKYPQVVVSNAQPLDQSHMFFLFYTQYPPEKYLKEGGTASGGFRESGNKFSNYIFRPIDWNSEEAGSLIVGRPSDIPDDVNPLSVIKYLNGVPAIVIAEKK